MKFSKKSLKKSLKKKKSPAQAATKSKFRGRVMAGGLAALVVAGCGAGGFAVYKSNFGGDVAVYYASDITTTNWEDQMGNEAQIGTDGLQLERVSDSMTVKTVSVEVGQAVKKGDTLFAYDTTLTDLDLQRKELQIKQEELELTNLQKELKVIRSYKPNVPIQESKMVSGVKTNATFDGLEYDYTEDGAEIPLMEGVKLEKGDGTQKNPFTYQWKDSFSYTALYMQSFTQGQREAFVTFYIPAPDKPVQEEDYQESDETPDKGDEGTDTESDTDKQDEPTEDTQDSADTANPVEPSEPSESTESSEPTESTEPTEPAESSEPTESTQSTEPTEPSEPIEDSSETADKDTSDEEQWETTDGEETGEQDGTEDTDSDNEDKTDESDATDTGDSSADTTDTTTDTTEGDSAEEGREEGDSAEPVEKPDEKPTPTPEVKPAEPSCWTMQFQLVDGVYQYQILSMTVGGVTQTIAEPMPTLPPETPVEVEPEPEPEPVADDDWLDWGEDDFSITYTQQELTTMIQEKEQAIVEQRRTIRGTELEYRKLKKEAGNSTVVAEMDGVVTYVGDKEDTNGTFVKVSASDGGYLIKTFVSELLLNTVVVGETALVKNEMTAESWEGVIQSVSEYPNKSFYSYSGNTNSSYYPVEIRLSADANLSEDDWIQAVFGKASTGDDALYLDNAFLVSENGKSYVYAKGDDGLLEKRQVSTGRSLYGYYTEIKNGMNRETQIAFPYGKNVRAGAVVREATIDELYNY